MTLPRPLVLIQGNSALRALWSGESISAFGDFVATGLVAIFDVCPPSLNRTFFSVLATSSIDANSASGITIPDA